MTHRIECWRDAASVCGSGFGYLKSKGRVVEFDTLEEAEAEAARLRAATTSPHVSYIAEKEASHGR